MQNNNLQGKVVLTIDDLATYTGWAKSYIYKLTANGTLKHSKPLGKTVFFSKEWIDNFLLSATGSTADEMEAEAATYVTLNKGGVR